MERYDRVHVNVFYSYDLYIPRNNYNDKGLLINPLHYCVDDGVGTSLIILVIPIEINNDTIKYKVDFTEKLSNPELIVGYSEGEVIIDENGKIIVNGVENGRLRDGKTMGYELFEYIDLIRIKR